MLFLLSHVAVKIRGLCSLYIVYDAKGSPGLSIQLASDELNHPAKETLQYSGMFCLVLVSVTNGYRSACVLITHGPLQVTCSAVSGCSVY